MLKIFSLEIQIEKYQREERSKNWPHKTKKKYGKYSSLALAERKTSVK
jgi:hypothetical protein